VTHRIVSADHQDGGAVLVLRGDANEAADATPYRVDDHADVVLFHVPRAGYVVGWMSSPFGLFLLGLYAAFLLSVIVRRTPEGGAGGKGGPLSPELRVVPPSPTHGRLFPRRCLRRRSILPGGIAVLLVSGGLAGATAEQRVTPTLAAWTDSVSVAGTQLTTATAVPTPSGFTCTGNGNPANTVTLTWSAVAGATYTVHFGSNDSRTTSGTSFTTAKNDRGIAWVTATRGTSTSADTVHQPYDHGDCSA
jgi:hypothetical protein